MTKFEKKFRKIASLATEIADLYESDEGRKALQKAHLTQGISNKKIWQRLHDLEATIRRAENAITYGPHHIKQLADPNYWIYSERYQKYAEKYCDSKEVVD